jgi:hypothetical protein
MSHKVSIPLIVKTVLWIVLCVLFVLLSTPLRAETGTGLRISKSITFSDKTTIDKTMRDEQLKQTEADIMAPLEMQGFRAESTVMALRIENASYYAGDSISIYDASTDLISDFNDDGFYHRFSVTIDADTIYNTAYVYARLYLSYQGGPWNHYATTNNYHISGDSELDVFTIETELADGYAPGYYDVRIELYDADLDVWVFSYGPYDDDSLSGLPLEDSFYDDLYRIAAYPIETEIIVSGHGHGSMSWWLLFIPALISLLRQRVKHDNTVRCC